MSLENILTLLILAVVIGLITSRIKSPSTPKEVEYIKKANEKTRIHDRIFLIAFFITIVLSFLYRIVENKDLILFITLIIFFLIFLTLMTHSLRTGIARLGPIYLPIFFERKKDPILFWVVIILELLILCLLLVVSLIIQKMLIT